MKIPYFEPLEFKNTGVKCRNRIGLSPMTNKQSHDDGTLSTDEFNWLVRRAKEGFGLVITCAANVSEDGRGWTGELGIYHDRHIKGLKSLTDAIRKEGSVSIVQLYHGGARSPEFLIGTQPWSASAHVYERGIHKVDVRAATQADIYRVIDDFVSAAQRAYEAGFDGVELHGAHGYLLHQFISTFTNKRDDEWGGNFENRIKLIVTILEKIRAVVPDGFLVGVRISPEDKHDYKGIDFDESLELAKILRDKGADFIDVSTWDYNAQPRKYSGDNKSMIKWFREALGPSFPIFVAGEIWSGRDAEKALSEGADLILLGKSAIGMPDWPTRAQDIDFEPNKPPYSEEHLRNSDLEPAFIKYMRKWKDFVVE